jgi:FAD binding domain
LLTVKWDDEVDVVCTGSGVAGLASAISAADVGGQVFVANSSGDTGACDTRVAVRSRVDRLYPWSGVDVGDLETNEYFAALSSDLGPLSRSDWDADVPIRVVHQRVPVESGRTVAPFIGARLRDWAARCLTSPSGFLYTRVSDGPCTTLHTSDGESVEVAEIGLMTPDPDDVGGSVFDWLAAQARMRRIDVHPRSALQRIVFEEGDPVGAVFTTSDGPLAIRARHGVIVSTGGPQVTSAARQQLVAGDAALRVCLVGRTASRFGRVELLTTEPLVDEPPPSACRPTNRQLHANLHETHTPLQTLRCGKVHGYPSPGQ